jgi:hypothetical protein
MNNSFELDINCGGFAPTTKLYRIQMDTTGEVIYSIMYPEDRGTGGWTVESQFSFTESEMNQIWNAIVSNDFFNLNELYEDNNVRDGTYAEMSITGESNTHTVRTENIAVVQFDNIVKIINSITPGDNDLFYNAIFNYRPYQPSMPSGPISGKPGTEYTYTSTATDYNSDQIYYLFNWGDDTDSGWVGPYNSGDTGSASHTWDSQDSYNITVRAKDDPNGDGDLSDGIESRWSDHLPVNMPKGKHSRILTLLRFLERFVERFPVLEYIFRFYEAYLPKITVTTFNDNSGTRVTRKDCEITVDLYIQIKGPCATVQVAKDIEANIEEVWNGDWMIKCEVGCDPRDPGCSVTFDAHVSKMDDMHYLPGAHDIEIVCDPLGTHRSNVMVRDADPQPAPNRVLDQPRPNDGTTTTGTWDTNEPANTYAHEAGHLMGLDDTYPPYQNEDDFDDHIMDDSGAVTQEDINLIVERSGVICPCECCPEGNDTEDPEVHITSPSNGTTITIPFFNITGYATDYGGSGVAELDYLLEWDGGSFDGTNHEIDPPEEEFGFNFGPIYFDWYLDPTDEWLRITWYAIDASGNIGSDTITVYRGTEDDTTPPVTEKTIGEPNEEGGYVIWPFTPITFMATDDMSGVYFIQIDVWWDSDHDMAVDTLVSSETIYNEAVTITVEQYGEYAGLIELQWYAVDNTGNVEETHYQEHFVNEYTLGKILNLI